MATFNYILGRKKDNGKYPIYLRITHRNKNTSLSLDIEVAKTEWSAARQRIKKSNTDIYDVRTEKEQIGITYKSLANIGIAPDKPYRNKYCTIRKGTLLTAPKALSDNAAE
jgi:hypothetical protein